MRLFVKAPIIDAVSTVAVCVSLFYRPLFKHDILLAIDPMWTLPVNPGNEYRSNNLIVELQSQMDRAANKPSRKFRKSHASSMVFVVFLCIKHISSGLHCTGKYTYTHPHYYWSGGY